MVLVALQEDNGQPRKEYVRAEDIVHTSYVRADKVRETIQIMGRRSNCGKVALFNDGVTGQLFSNMPDTYEECFHAGTIAVVQK